MNRFRSDFATAIAPLCVASFGTHLWLFGSYFSSHPRRPDIERGLVNALNNHGSYAYISDTEITGLSLLMITFVAGIFLTILVVPKTPILPTRGVPTWVSRVGFSYHAEWSSPKRRAIAIFFIALVVYEGIILAFGPSIVDAFVFDGFVVRSWI